jgi:hypothetical protein
MSSNSYSSSLPTKKGGPPTLGADPETLPACVVCLEEVSFSIGACRALTCAHVFHSTCIASWLEYRDTCPTCRNKECEVGILVQAPSAEQNGVWWNRWLQRHMDEEDMIAYNPELNVSYSPERVNAAGSVVWRLTEADQERL